VHAVAALERRRAVAELLEADRARGRRREAFEARRAQVLVEDLKRSRDGFASRKRSRDGFASREKDAGRDVAVVVSDAVALAVEAVDGARERLALGGPEDGDAPADGLGPGRRGGRGDRRLVALEARRAQVLVVDLRHIRDGFASEKGTRGATSPSS
jgi:hypothetical protein